MRNRAFMVASGARASIGPRTVRCVEDLVERRLKSPAVRAVHGEEDGVGLVHAAEEDVLRALRLALVAPLRAARVVKEELGEDRQLRRHWGTPSSWHRPLALAKKKAPSRAGATSGLITAHLGSRLPTIRRSVVRVRPLSCGLSALLPGVSSPL